MFLLPVRAARHRSHPCQKARKPVLTSEQRRVNTLQRFRQLPERGALVLKQFTGLDGVIQRIVHLRRLQLVILQQVMIGLFRKQQRR